jgi:hypothetical protein
VVDPLQHALIARQRGLQDEASTLRTELGLDAILGAVGEPIVVGSAALGLMTWRDLDITVVSEQLDLRAVLDVVHRIGMRPEVSSVRFRNDTGRWNTDPAYPDGLYVGVECVARSGEAWNLDIWFVDEPDRQPDLAHLSSLPPRLDDDTRVAILTIKDAWCTSPTYGSEVTSHEIYEAVLDHGVRTVDEFEAHRSDDGA